MLGFLGIENLHKKFEDDIWKTVDFFLMLTFDGLFFVFKTIQKRKKMTTKS